MKKFYSIVAGLCFLTVATAGASVYVYGQNGSGVQLTAPYYIGFAVPTWLGFACLRARRSRIGSVVRRGRLAEGACPGSGGFTTEIPAEMIYVTYTYGGQWQERTPARSKRHTCEVCGYTPARA